MTYIITLIITIVYILTVFTFINNTINTDINYLHYHLHYFPPTHFLAPPHYGRHHCRLLYPAVFSSS